MHHLTDEQIVDAAEGHPEGTVSAHLSGCAACTARVADTRDLLDAMTSVPVPEPSPLFWEHFAACVNDAIDARPPSRSWLPPGRLAWIGAAAVVLITMGLYAARPFIGLPPGEMTAPPASVQGSPAPTADPAAGVLPLEESVDDDAAWAAVQSAARHLRYDDARDAGILPHPAAVERAATELSQEERAELVRLIQDELKRTGA